MNENRGLHQPLPTMLRIPVAYIVVGLAALWELGVEGVEWLFRRRQN